MIGVSIPASLAEMVANKSACAVRTLRILERLLDGLQRR